jgi:signal transduction histidine kinase/CheY-like chemotaxis protein
MTTATSVVVKAPAREALLTRPKQAHIVQFYEAEAQLIAAVSRYLLAGLAAGEPLVVVATPEHHVAFTAELAAAGFDVRPLQETGRLTLLDARETLAAFMRDDEPDADAFDASIGAVLARVQAMHGAAPIRAYGEMVDLLWRDGKAQAALKLEGLWNDLARRRTFSLFCAYVMGNFYRVDGIDGMDAVCAAHSHVLSESTSELDALRAQAQTLRREVNERRRLEAALRNALDDAAASRAQLEALHRIGKALHSELDLERVVQRVTDEGTAICHAEFGAFFYNLIDARGESYMLYTLAGVPRERFAGFPMPRNTQVFAPTFSGEGVVRIDDITKDPHYGRSAPYHGMPEGHLPVCSYLAVPVVGRSGEVLGGLFFGHSRPGVFTQADEDAVVGIASHAAIAIENARTYEAERRARIAADADRARTEHLQKLTAELSRALSAEDAARVVIRQIRELLGMEAGGVLLLDESGTRIETFVTDGDFQESGVKFAMTHDLSTPAPLFDAVRTGELVWVVGEAAIAQRYPHLESLRRMNDGQTWGALPVTFEGRILGAIGLRSATSRELTEGEREFLLALSRQCGQALERARLHDATQAARAEAEQASRAKDDFLAMLGHELRNPLSPILTAVQLMRARGDTSSSREQSIIERQVNHLIHLVDDLLDISRITRGKVELERRPHKLTALVSKAVEVVTPLVEERRHRLTVSVPSEDIWLRVDDFRICQVLTNLLTNAAKYTERGGTIHLSASREGAEAAIRVTDNGTGITADLLPRVFDLFVQGFGGGDRSHGGLGIGLALVHNLVQLHGGSVTAFSQGAGKGSEFVVKLPAIEAARGAVHTDGERSIRERVEVVSRRVLLVDDNEDAALLLGDLLRSVGHDVRVAHDGASAIDAATRFRPEIAILDIGLPDMDGHELAVAIRERLDTKVRLMALTGYGQQNDVARTERAGFEAHFVKPVALAKLLTEIEMSRSARS